jgi:hypothetical protein
VLRADLSPQTVAAIVVAVGSGLETAASFYRNEAVPTAPPASCGDIACGPYALIQGRLEGLLDTPDEAMPIVRRGFVARIQRGPDFFVALADHNEWGHSFTVWGEVRDEASMATLEAITALPYHEQKAAGAATIMRLLDEELPARGTIVMSGTDQDRAAGTTELQLGQRQAQDPSEVRLAELAGGGGSSAEEQTATLNEEL